MHRSLFRFLIFRGAALSVGSGSLDLDGVSTAWDTALPDDIEAELRESAKRVDAVTTLAGLDKLIADAKAERRGELRERLPRLPIGPNTTVTIWIPDDVTAYLKGEIDDIPGTPPLTPGSVTSAPEADDPFAKPNPEYLIKVVILAVLCVSAALIFLLRI